MKGRRGVRDERPFGTRRLAASASFLPRDTLITRSYLRGGTGRRCSDVPRELSLLMIGIA